MFNYERARMLSKIKPEVEVPNGLEVVIWGLRKKRDTFRYIHMACFNVLKKSGASVIWVDDHPRNRSAVSNKSIVLAVNNASKHLPKVKGTRYVLHNINPEPFLPFLNKRSHLLQIQVWTKSALGNPQAQELIPCVSLDTTNYVLYQPWGTPFAIHEWVRKPIKAKLATEFWIGSVWNNALNQGNRQMYGEWLQVLRSHGIDLRKMPYGWPDTKFTYGSLVRLSSIAGAVVGEWQRDNGYIPCRLFKNISFGAVPVGNSRFFSRIFGASAVTGDSLEEVLSNYLELALREKIERLHSAQELMIAYTYEAAFNRILAQVL